MNKGFNRKFPPKKNVILNASSSSSQSDEGEKVGDKKNGNNDTKDTSSSDDQTKKQGATNVNETKTDGGSDSSKLYLIVMNAIKTAVAQVLEDKGIREFLAEKGIEKSELLEEILSKIETKPTVKSQKAPAPQKNNPELIQQYQEWMKENYDDKWTKECSQGKACNVHYGARPPKGKKAYTYCAKPGGPVCDEEKDTPQGKKILEASKAKGYSYDKYRETKTKARIVAAKKKLAQLEGHKNGDIKVDKNDGSSEEEDKYEKCNEYEHKDNCKYVEEHGLVAEKTDNGYEIIGRDDDNGGTIGLLDQNDVTKYEKLGFIVNRKAMDKDCQDALKKKEEQKTKLTKKVEGPRKIVRK